MLLLIRDTNKLIFIQLQHVTSTDARLSLTTLLRCAMFLIEFHFVDWMQQKPSMSLVLPKASSTLTRCDHWESMFCCWQLLILRAVVHAVLLVLAFFRYPSIVENMNFATRLG